MKTHNEYDRKARNAEILELIGRRMSCRLSGVVRTARASACLVLLAVFVSGACPPRAECGWHSVPAPLPIGPYFSPYTCIPRFIDHSGNLWALLSTAGAISPIESVFVGLCLYDGFAWREMQGGTPRTGGEAWSVTGSIAEDSTGGVWVCSTGGVRRYDGIGWTRYTPAEGLGDSSAYGVMTDRSGRVWFGSESEERVSYFVDGTWAVLDVSGVSAGPPLARVLPLCQDTAGNIWFGASENRALRFDGSSWATFLLPFSGPSDVWSIVETRDGELLLGAGHGIVRLVAGVMSFVHPPPPYSDNVSFTGLAKDRIGNVWAMGPHGLARYFGGKLRRFDGRDGLPPYLPYPLVTDPFGGLWLAGSGRVLRFDGEYARNFTPDGVDLSGVNGIWTDRSGNVWIGPAKFDGNGMANYRDSTQLATVYRWLHEDRTGANWFGTDRGLARYDGTTWRIYTQSDNLTGNSISSIAEDVAGNIWAVSYSGSVYGVSRFDGTTWQTYTTSDGLPSGLPNGNERLFADDRGNVWFLGAGRVARFVEPQWTQYSLANGFVDDPPGAFEQDAKGRFLVQVSGTLARFDNGVWAFFTIPSWGCFPAYLTVFRRDRDHNLWFASGCDISRFNGDAWTTYTDADGVTTYAPYEILGDRAGHVWYGNQQNVNHFDGEKWHALMKGTDFAVPSPLSTPIPVLADSTGGLWFLVDGGNSVSGFDTYRYYPDLVSPIVRFISLPPRVSPTGTLSASFVATYEENPDLEYSYQVDDGAWSGWSAVGLWTDGSVSDGSHRLRARARDTWGNVTTFPVIADFEVDATQPAAILASPSFGSPVRGVVEARGDAADSRFSMYRLEYRPAGGSSWSGSTLLVESTTQVSNGSLGQWDTSALPDGAYDLRLSVTDSLGLVGSAQVTVAVDNHAPFFDETAPAKVTAATGGDVYTTNAEAHLYFPPHAFAQDAVVMVTASAAGSVPASLPSGAAKVLDGYELAWTDVLKKPAQFTMSYAGATPAAGTLALYHSPDGTNWERLGGTIDADAKNLSLAVSVPGRYALFADNGVGTGAATLSTIAFTPRVFSPRGGFADSQVGISFSLGKPAPVTVKVYSRSGRLIREVATGLQLNAGNNLIRWDGTDRNGGYAVDGLYFVTVEALGHTETKTLAVVK